MICWNRRLQLLVLLSRSSLKIRYILSSKLTLLWSAANCSVGRPSISVTVTFADKNVKTRTLRDAKLRQGQNVIRDLNPDFRINSYPGVCRIGVKMLWIYFLVSMRHFAKCRKNLPVIVWNVLINLLKFPFHNGEKMKSNPESVSGTGSSPNVNYF